MNYIFASECNKFSKCSKSCQPEKGERSLKDDGETIFGVIYFILFVYYLSYAFIPVYLDLNKNLRKRDFHIYFIKAYIKRNIAFFKRFIHKKHNYFQEKLYNYSIKYLIIIVSYKIRQKLF